MKDWFDAMCVRASYRAWWRLEDMAANRARRGQWAVASELLARADECLADARELGEVASLAMGSGGVP